MELTSDLLRGHTDTIILGILLDGRKYGYEIYKCILEMSENMYELKEPTLYSAYKRLESEGLIVGIWGNIDITARRKYYSITPKGLERYKQNIQNWAFSKKLIDKLLSIDGNN